jgi:hypothetical protein
MSRALVDVSALRRRGGKADMASDLSHGAPPTTPPQITPPPGTPLSAPPAPPAPAAPPKALDAGITPVIRYSAGRLAQDQDEFIRQLHYDVTSLIPGEGGGRARDMRALCERIVRSLLWVALTDQPLPVAIDALHQVGALNWADGFPEAQYGNFAHALVQTVHYLSESDWSASTGSAWLSYFMWAKPHLLAGARQAAARQAVTQQAAARQAAAHRAVAEQEAARVEALSKDVPGGHVGEVNLESVASLLEDEEDRDTGYGQIMLGMTRPRRDPPR